MDCINIIEHIKNYLILVVYETQNEFVKKWQLKFLEVSLDFFLRKKKLKNLSFSHLFQP